ncbi:sugar kinase [Cohnella nanjingensis]|uniref:Sugar kinase n=1 Tax=Cohnella nanjingensis TaxID=1387779 RepID=A0A7X0RKC8_9BACL|nr:sugar kinase [Cohnella nanjingensis]MBB6669089.1 sugar kinase [Cohnella nanjingensis]
MTPNQGKSASPDRPEVVTFGETMALLIGGSKGIEHSPSMEKSFGGAESNVAIGLARLGHRAGWFGKLGDDPLGRSILKTIRGEGVDVSRAALTAEAPTGLMLREQLAGRTSVYYYRKLSAASGMQPSDLDADYISQAKLLHLTGITPALSPSCRATVLEAVRIAKASGVPVLFDPNLRLKLWSLDEARSVLLPLAREADYFLPGLDELKLLYETEDFETIVQRLRELPGVSIVKGGDEETYYVDREQVTAVPYFKARQVVDPIGAGDGFCAGFLSGLLRGWAPVEAVRLGNLVGSMVVQVEGDWEGLPTGSDVDALLGKQAHIER